MTENRLKAHDDMSMEDIFRTNKYSMNIPLNQRKFDWNMSEIEDYWEDFQKILNGDKDSHYLGVLSFIITDDPNHPNRFDGSIYEVTDGQQRIITTSLLVSALRDVYLSLNNDKEAEKIQEEYFICDEINALYDKITVSRLDQYTFETLVNIHRITNSNFELLGGREITLKKNGGRKVKKDSSQYINKKMVDTYNFFYNEIVDKYNKISDVEEKGVFLKNIQITLKRLQIIVITSRDAEFLYMFFDTINNRGLQLSKMDIIRNKLLSIITNISESSVTNISRLWDELVIILDELDVSRFLKYYYMCSQEKILSSNELPNRYEKLFLDLNDYSKVEKELERMIDYAKIYAGFYKTFDSNINSEQYIKSISNINDIGQQACYSFLMDYFYYVEDTKRRNVMTQALEKFMFRRVISKSSSKKLDGIFRRMIQTGKRNITGKLYNDKVLLEVIKGENPSEDTFSYNFINKEWDRSSLTNYVLRQIEYKLINDDSEYRKIIKSRKEVHIEHIAPESPTTEWLEYLKLDKNKYKEYVNQLGNLILLKSNLNMKAKRKSFSEKKEMYYNESDLKQVEGICNLDKWTKLKIDKRTKNLYENYKDLWRI